MSSPFRSSVIDLDTACSEFARQFNTPGSGILSVDRHGNSIRVVVDSIVSANALPISFQGATVAAFLKTGKTMRLLLRSRHGKVTNP